MGTIFGNRKIFPCILLIIGVFGQVSKAQTDTIPNVDGSTLESINVPAISDSLIIDNENQADSSIAIENDVFESAIFYSAEDSIIYDALEKKVLLYGKAIVKYEQLQLEAGFIEFGFETNEACASGVIDSTGATIGKPVFSDEKQSFTQESLCYNFKTQEGRSFQAITQEGDAFLHSAISKRHSNEWIHIKNGKFTTCDAENPHYHFHLSKAIVIPNDKIVTGPIYMKVRKVPLPLALPFAWFPNQRKGTHGLIIPGYGNAQELGFFLKDLGYYIPFKDYADTKFLFDIYSRGSWTARNVTNYRRRYKYSGNFDISRTERKNSLPELPDYSRSVDFFVKWNHVQDSKARPGTSFRANVNFGTTTNIQNNLNTPQEDFLQNTFSSSIDWAKSFNGTLPSRFSIGARHAQNSSTKNVDIVLPSIQYSISRFQPFKNYQFGGSTRQNWINKLGFTYSSQFENSLRVQEDQLKSDSFQQLNNEMKNGVRHQFQLSTNMNSSVFTFTPTFRANEYWTFKHLEHAKNPETGTQKVDTLQGFKRAGDWGVGINATSKVYGTFVSKRGKYVKALRHVMTPNVGFTYNPKTDHNVYGFFGEDGSDQSYNPFEVASFRPSTRSEAANLTFGLQNNIELKTRDRKNRKQAYKKMRLIDDFSLSSSYNLIADSLNLAPLRMSAFTNVSIFNFNFNANYDFYDRDSSGVKVNEFMLSSQQKLARLTNARIGVQARLKSKKRKGDRKTDRANEQELGDISEASRGYVDWNVPWSLNLNYTANINKTFLQESQKDSVVLNQSVLFNGDVSIFDKWKLGFDSGYDIVAREFTPTRLNLYWDLHCWEVVASWVPIGTRKNWSVQLNIKSALLKDLKLQRRGAYGSSSPFY